MNVTRCKQCKSDILSSRRICPKCGTVQKNQNDLLVYCALTWVLAVAAVVYGAVQF